MSKKVEYLLIRNEPRFEGDDENWVSCVELTKEELISLGMSTELVVKVVAMGINVNIKKLQKKIRKVLE